MNSFPFFCAPALEYLAPEYLLEQRCDAGSDIFSLGCILYALCGDGTSPLECNSIHSWKEKVAKLERISYREIRDDAANLIKRMIARSPGARIGLKDVEQSGYFDNVLVNTIGFLDTFAEKGLSVILIL